MSDFSKYDKITDEDVRMIKAIIEAFYGESTASRFTSETISDETIKEVAYLLAETVDCSKWMDAVPNPTDILMPAKNLKKWALRLIRSAGRPFLYGNARVTVACRNFRAAQLKTEILMSLK